MFLLLLISMGRAKPLLWFEKYKDVETLYMPIHTQE